MPHVVREGRAGDMGGSGKNAGNNWHKFNTDPKNEKYGKEGKKKEALQKHRKAWNAGGMTNRDGEKTEE